MSLTKHIHMPALVSALGKNFGLELESELDSDGKILRIFVLEVVSSPDQILSHSSLKSGIHTTIFERREKRIEKIDITCWTVVDLLCYVGLSESAAAQRFAELLGSSESSE